MATGKNSISKTRNWAFIIYPDSAPENWQCLLADTHIPSFISPIHDMDVDENGELKKPHFHIVLSNDGPITQKRANEIMEPFCGTKSAEYVMSLRGYVRYLAHLDDPDKAQYDPAEIIALSGADLGELLKPNTTDKYKIIGEILRFCEDQGIQELSTLSNIAINNRMDWLPLIVERAYYFTQCLASRRYSRKNR